VYKSLTTVAVQQYTRKGHAALSDQYFRHFFTTLFNFPSPTAKKKPRTRRGFD
jgi:hypothetical protein